MDSLKELQRKKCEFYIKHKQIVGKILQLQIILLDTSNKSTRDEINKDIRSLSKQAKSAIYNARITRGRIKSLQRTMKNIRKQEAIIKKASTILSIEREILDDKLTYLRIEETERISRRNRNIRPNTSSFIDKLNKVAPTVSEQQSQVSFIEIDQTTKSEPSIH